MHGECRWRSAPGGGWVVEGPYQVLADALSTGTPVMVKRRDGSRSTTRIEKVLPEYWSPVDSEYRALGWPVGYEATMEVGATTA